MRSAQSGNGRRTLEQVASEAGVSRSTVSRVINGEPYVSRRVRDRVTRAIEALGYVPNPAARTLVTQRTGLVALVFPEPDTKVFSEPFFAGIVRGVSQHLRAADMQLVLVMAQGEADHERLERYVAGGHVDGVLLVSLHTGDRLPAALAELNVPAVLNGNTGDEPPPLPYVDVDNRGGAAIATRYLRDRGRRRIATISGPGDMCAGVDRLAGYADALGDWYRPELVAEGDFSRESGERRMAELLERAPDLDAVFAASDLMAEGAMWVLRDRGRRVPEDVAVIGFDDTDRASYTTPPLTTIRQPIVRIGGEMVNALLELTHGNTVTPVILPVELVVRASA